LIRLKSTCFWQFCLECNLNSYQRGFHTVLELLNLDIIQFSPFVVLAFLLSSNHLGPHHFFAASSFWPRGTAGESPSLIVALRFIKRKIILTKWLIKTKVYEYLYFHVAPLGCRKPEGSLQLSVIFHTNCSLAESELAKMKNTTKGFPQKDCGCFICRKTAGFYDRIKLIWMSVGKQTFSLRPCRCSVDDPDGTCYRFDPWLHWQDVLRLRKRTNVFGN